MEDKVISPRINKIHLVSHCTTSITFLDSVYEISCLGNTFKVAKDPENFVELKLVNQHIASKAAIMGGYAISEEKTGNIDYLRHFSVDWEDELCIPELYFNESPSEIARSYKKGQKIELGIERVSHYHVVYADGVEAHFKRKEDKGFSFEFSTGFYGTFQEFFDGSYTLTFKGDRLAPGEDDYSSQSKFVVTRSKYTGKLLLILQEDAVVYLK
jgi:hypothetical protein